MGSNEHPAWKKWDVLDKPGPLYVPHFMTESVEAAKILQEHWERVLKVLDGEGYEALVTMRDRLKQKREAVKETLTRWQHRTRYVHLAMIAYANPERWADENGSVPEDVHERPMGEILLTRNGAARGDLILDEGWEIDSGVWTNDPTELTLDDWSVAYRPTGDVLKRYNINPEYVEPLDSRSFTAADTWQFAVGRLQDIHARNADRQYFFGRTEQTIAFRLDVVEAVLYRFEVFGSVEPLTPEGAEGLAEEQLKPEEVKRRTTPRQREDASTMLRFARKEDPNSYSDLHIPLELHDTDGRKGESITRSAQRFVENAFGTYPDDVSECVKYLEEAAVKGYLPTSDTSEGRLDTSQNNITHGLE